MHVNSPGTSASIFSSKQTNAQDQQFTLKDDNKTPPTSTRSDSVILSSLASSLKGDALSLFGNLSLDDRMSVSGIVKSGKMSADEVNDALSDKMKEARGRSFWKSHSESKEQSPDQDTVANDQSRIDALNDVVEKKMKQMAGVVRLEDAEKITKSLEEEFSQLDSLIGRSVGKNLGGAVSLSGKFALSHLYRSDSEREAGSKLTSAGFASKSFDQTVTAMADDDIQRYLSGQRSASPG